MLGPGEPLAGPWSVTPIRDFVQFVSNADRTAPERPWIVAVDGRGGGGKSTVAAVLHRAVPASTIVHTDDVAWHYSFFGWSTLLIEGILQPLHRGNAVRYRPPGWDTHGRPGAIEIAAGLDLVVVEGVGASRTELLPWIDRALWVQSDFAEAERRGIARDGGTGAVRDFWHEWMAEEIPFLHQQRPWERATLVVNGTPTQPYDPATEIVVAPALHQARSHPENGAQPL